MDDKGIVAVSPSTAGGLLAAMHGGAGELGLPKPFSAPICIIAETRVAGTTHITDIDKLVGDLSEGARLTLQRLTRSRQDAWAIRVLDAQGRRLGYLAADVNEIPARLMDGGKHLYAEVTGVERRGSWWKISIGVWLDD